MGRVARYKKVKSVDPFAKNGSSWKSDVGDCTTLRRVKRRSKTAQKHKEQKMKKRNRKSVDGGSNGFGNDDGFDLPPSGKDEWDWSDIVGSVKSQPHKKEELSDLNATPMPTVIPSKGSAHKVAALDKKKQSKLKKTAIPSNIGDKITSRTSTREIIETYSRPNSSKRLLDNGAADSETNKAKKKKAFLDSKKNKKRRRQMEQELDDEEYASRQKALRSLHSSQSSPDIAQPKTHLVKQNNFSETLRTRTVIDSQVERPPIFSSLPRGATKLKKAAVSVEGRNDRENDNQRIKKEQQQMELMRQRVMQSYAKLRESRRMA